MKKQIIPIIYLITFLLFWIILAINPISRYTWFVENVILIIFLIILIFTYKYYKFSNLSYFLIFIFLILQTIGAHYTYMGVPMEWFSTLFGFERNHFDRIVHFSFGLLLSFPFREFLIKTIQIKNQFWTYYFPVEMALGTGAVYEIIEWIYAINARPSLGNEFLGSQGDIWDAQADMFFAGLGALISMVLTLLVCLFIKNEKKQK